MAPKKLTQSGWSKFLLLAVALALLTGTASAQNPLMPSFHLGGEQKRQLTPEEQERQKQIDNDYKAATSRVPDQKANDPWAAIRPAPSTPSPKKPTVAGPKKQQQ